jgi:phosphohistidine phosphatase SixA
MRYLFVVFLLFCITSCSQTIYVVRHAEKATPMGNNTDVPLSTDGEKRAEAIKEILKDKHIGQIYSTNTIRTKLTAKPTADYFHLTINTYGPKPDSAFISLLESEKKNTLVVGHSNTVDDIVNMLCGEKKVPGDLQDSEYNHFYILKRSGKKYSFQDAGIF